MKPIFSNIPLLSMIKADWQHWWTFQRRVQFRGWRSKYRTQLPNATLLNQGHSDSRDSIRDSNYLKKFTMLEKTLEEAASLWKEEWTIPHLKQRNKRISGNPVRFQSKR